MTNLTLQIQVSDNMFSVCYSHKPRGINQILRILGRSSFVLQTRSFTQVGLKVSDLEGCLNRIKVPHFFVAVSLGRRRNWKNDGRVTRLRCTTFVVGGKTDGKSILLITVCLGLHFKQPNPALCFSKDEEHPGVTNTNLFLHQLSHPM